MRGAQGHGNGKGQPVHPPPSKPKLRKGLWSPEENDKLINYIMKNGLMGCWSSIAKQSGLQRCGKSCRLRWMNYLSPYIKHGAFSLEENQLIIHLHSILGNRWSQIAACLPGRTDNEIKNYCKSNFMKKMMKHSLFSSSRDCNGNKSMNSSTDYNGNKKTKSNIRSQSGHTYTTNSVYGQTEDHGHGACPSFHSAQPLDVYQLPIEILNLAVTTAENRYSCVQDLLGLKHEQVQNQNHDFSIERSENNIDGKIFNEKKIMIDYSPFTAASSGISGWSATHSYSKISADCCHVVDAGAFATQEGISMLKNYENLHEKTMHQTYPPLNSSQFIAPAMICSTGQSQGEDYSKDQLNLRYGVNLGVPTYIYIDSNYQFPHIDGEGSCDQWDFSRIPHEEAKENPFP